METADVKYKIVEVISKAKCKYGYVEWVVQGS
jgi:hypothetical protein